MTENITTQAPSRLGVLTAYFLIYVVWGSTYYFIGVALQGFPPFLLGGLRFTAAGLLLLLFSRTRGEDIFKGSLVRKSAISGVVLLFVDMAVIMLAQQHLGSSLVAILASSTAVWILALDAPRWKTNFRIPAVVIGITAGFLGVMLLFIEQMFQSGENIHGAYGVGLMVLGCISWAAGTLYAKYKSCSEEKRNDFAGAAWQMLVAGATFWACSWAIREADAVSWNAVPPAAWFSLVYLVLFGSILAYTSYIWLLKVRPATEVGTHAYVNPLVAVVLGNMLGGEEISWVQITGLCIILSSIALVQKPSGRRLRESAPLEKTIP